MNKQVEQIEAEIERWKKELRLSTSCEAKYRREMLDDMSKFIYSLQREPASEDMESAAEDYMQTEIDTDCDYYDETGEPLYFAEALKIAFIEGARWQKEQEMQDRLKSDNTVFQKFYGKGKADMKEQMMKDAVDGKTEEELSELFEDEVQIPPTVDKKKKKKKNPRTQFEIKSLYGRRLSDEYQWCVNNLPLKEDRGLNYWVTEIYIITSSQAIIDKVNKHFGSSFDFKNNWNSRTFFLN